MKRQCKICGGQAHQEYTIDNINYYHCRSCNFLQNYYWDRDQADQEKVSVNSLRRTQRWPAGEKDYMYGLGRNYLEVIVWPLAWHSRKAHQAFKSLPPYTAWVKRLITQKMHRVLDFGCGHGISVLELRQRDHIDAIGLDPYSPTNSPHIIRQDIFKQHFPNNHFDAIFTIETMEHIPNILETFRELRRILRPGGTLLVQTHRLEHPDYQTQKGDWFYLEHPKTHVSIYSQPAMRRIADKTGWQAVRFHGPRLAKFIK